MVNLKKQVDKFREITGLIAKSLKGWHCAQRALSVVLSVALVLAFVPKTAFGALEDPIAEETDDIRIYESGNIDIKTAEGFMEVFVNRFTAQLNFKDKIIKLIDNINLSGHCSMENPLTIGSYNGNSTDRVFSGTLDGDGHTISALCTSKGLFACIYTGGTVKNLTMDNLTSPEGNSNRIGGICGDIDGGTISDCVVNGTITGGNNTGGICGYGYNSTISNCVVNGTITGGNNTGGICGYYGNISNCIVNGTINGGDNVGGICGYGQPLINSCANFADISGNLNVGGIGGCFGPRIDNCYNVGTITGANAVGGIFGGGAAQTATPEINNCYNSGAVNVTGYDTSGTIQDYGASLAGSSNALDVNRSVGLSPYVRGVSDSSYNTINRVIAIWRAPRDIEDPEANYARSDMVLHKKPPKDGVEISVDNVADGEDLLLNPGWQQKFIDLGWDETVWNIPVTDANSSDYLYAKCPTLKAIDDLDVKQEPWLQPYNDIRYACRKDNTNKVDPNILGEDLDNGLTQLNIGPQYFDYTQGIKLLSLNSTDPNNGLFEGWAIEGASDAVVMEIAPTDKHSENPFITCVASFSTPPEAAPEEEPEERVFETQLPNGRFVRVVDRNNQINPAWRLVVEVIDGNLQEHGLDEWRLADTEHGVLYQIYFVDENSNKVGPVNLEYPVEVWVPVPDGYDLDDLKMLYLVQNADDEEHRIIRIENVDGHTYAVFETNHFSPYSLIDILNEQEKAELAANSKNPATNDEFYIFVFLVTSGILVSAMLATFAKVSSNRKKNEAEPQITNTLI